MCSSDLLVARMDQPEHDFTRDRNEPLVSYRRCPYQDHMADCSMRGVLTPESRREGEIAARIAVMQAWVDDHPHQGEDWPDCTTATPGGAP